MYNINLVAFQPFSVSKATGRDSEKIKYLGEICHMSTPYKRLFIASGFPFVWFEYTSAS